MAQTSGRGSRLGGGRQESATTGPAREGSGTPTEFGRPPRKGGTQKPRGTRGAGRTAPAGGPRVNGRIPRLGGRGKSCTAKIGVLVISAGTPRDAAGIVDAVAGESGAGVAEVYLPHRGSLDAGSPAVGKAGDEGPAVGKAGDEGPAAGEAGDSIRAGSGVAAAPEQWPAIVHLAPQRGEGDIQKAALKLAIEAGLDVLAVLRSAGPQAHEALRALVAPVERGECDAVIGVREPSRLRAGDDRPAVRRHMARAALTRLDGMLGTQLSDLHSGWRAYRLEAMASIPFEGNGQDAHFNLQVVLQLLKGGHRILEVPVPEVRDQGLTAPEALRRARDTWADVLRVRLGRRGYLSGRLGGVSAEYQLKSAPNSSHSMVLRWLGQMPAGRILDLGCSSGLLAERFRALGHRVTGVDVQALPGVTERVDRFIAADLDRGLPAAVAEEGPFDVVVAADVIEHVRDPDRLMGQIRSVMVPRGTLILSVPNFGHWYPRLRTAVGLFDYDQRGILDVGHVRFFTRRGLLDLIRRTGFTVTQRQATGLPLEVISSRAGAMGRGVRVADRLAVQAWPTLFGYQFVVRCETPPAAAGAAGAASATARSW